MPTPLMYTNTKKAAAVAATADAMTGNVIAPLIVAHETPFVRRARSHGAARSPLLAVAPDRCMWMSHQSSEDLLAPLTQRRVRWVRWAARRLPTWEDAEDVVQQAFAKAAAHSAQLRDEEALVAWFWQILRRTLSDYLAGHTRRMHQRDRIADLERAEPVHVPAPDAENVCQCGVEELDALPASQRRVITRVDMRGDTFAEAAEALGITPNNARVRAHRGRQTLRQRLEERCGITSPQTCISCEC